MKNKKIANYLIVILLFSSCLPVYDSKVIAVFVNNTVDTLFIAAAHYDNIDSVECQLYPRYVQPDSAFDALPISLWNKVYVEGNHVYPDSSCTINGDYLFNEYDSCYFFLIKWKDAKKYSWNEIRSKKLYHRMVVARDKNGKFNTDIKY